ncbi:hypothetical protein M758_3G011500 [Ceratodon purpureus]|nr:hypothetical protein M758_3G011500 [Ceratodon purpureus]
MDALRLHKGTVLPGRERMRETRRFLQASRQRAARGSLLQGLRSFLTADSFMYGPLLEESPPSTQAVNRLSDDDSEPRTPDDGSLRDNDTNGREGETHPDKNVEDNGHDETPRRHQGSHSTQTILSVQRTTRTGRTVVPSADGNCRTPTSAVRVKEGDEGSFLLRDQNEDVTSSMTSSYDDEDLIPLDNEIACKVVQMLLTKVGGRHSTELGLNVDAGDEEVEKWFLAVTLFHRHLTFDVLKKTFQKLESANIVSVRGVLHMEEDDIADILETAGYTTYKHRAAARIRKLAVQLETEYEGRVSSLKHIQDSHELCRHISNLHGLTTNTCNVFLRELRGIWPGAAADYDKRTNRAAMHLRIAECGKSEEQTSNKSSVSNPPISLKQIAHDAEVDERDLEVALVKLGLAHERHYRDCPGGPVCNFLVAPSTATNGED